MVSHLDPQYDLQSRFLSLRAGLAGKDFSCGFIIILIMLQCLHTEFASFLQVSLPYHWSWVVVVLPVCFADEETEPYFLRHHDLPTLHWDFISVFQLQSEFTYDFE